MIYVNSIINVTDNSGINKVRCIKVLKGSLSPANIGDVILVSVISYKSSIAPNLRKKGKLFYAIVVRTKKGLRIKNGISYKFIDNAVILLTSIGNPVGSVFIGPIPALLRRYYSLKLLSLANSVI